MCVEILLPDGSVIDAIDTNGVAVFETDECYRPAGTCLCNLTKNDLLRLIANSYEFGQDCQAVVIVFREPFSQCLVYEST